MVGTESEGELMDIQIETERLILRQFTEADLSDLVKIASQEHILAWCPDWNNCAEWVQDWFKGIKWRYTIADPNKEFILLAIIEKSTDELIGQINTGCECKEELPGELSVGYYISKDKLNKGYATEAVKAMTQHFFPINPNNFFYLIIRPANAASHRVAEKAGFQFASEITLMEKETGKPILMHYFRLEK
jgi:RimJ/RimL family protein N-acetyltransferase